MVMLPDKAVCTFLAHANSIMVAMLCSYQLRGSGSEKLEMNVSHQLPDCLKVTTALTTLLAVSGCLCQVVACHACTMTCHSVITESNRTDVLPFSSGTYSLEKLPVRGPNVAFCLAQIISRSYDAYTAFTGCPRLLERRLTQDWECVTTSRSLGCWVSTNICPLNTL